MTNKPQYKAYFPFIDKQSDYTCPRCGWDPREMTCDGHYYVIRGWGWFRKAYYIANLRKWDDVIGNLIFDPDIEQQINKEKLYPKYSAGSHWSNCMGKGTTWKETHKCPLCNREFTIQCSQDC